MTTFEAQVINVRNPIIAQVNQKKINFNVLKKTAFINNHESNNFGHVVNLTSNSTVIKNNKSHAYNIDTDDLTKISEDDILQIMPEGRVNILWEKKLNPYDITLFITNQCNANCIMCPQPPKKDEYSLLDTNKLLLKYLRSQPINKIGITGGEPTVKHKDLKELLSLAYEYYPTAKIDLLTNGKKLSDFNITKELAISNPNITFCISFPSDNEKDFNRILESKSIYTNVLKSIQNLAILKQTIELRIVITKQNYKRLEQISEFIYRNFPFIYHITFMGMEVIGHAFDNYDEIKINPLDYQENLLKAVQFLNRRSMHVSIYNIPYCLIDERLWKFLRNSISAWKQNYKDECNLCVKKETCPGIFSTSKILENDLIPIRN